MTRPRTASQLVRELGYETDYVEVDLAIAGYLDEQDDYYDDDSWEDRYYD